MTDDAHEQITDFGVLLRDRVAPAGWTVEGGAEGTWCRATPPGDPAGPSQGWKLHVSASDASAVTVLATAVPVLLAAGVPFKIASTRRNLSMLNQGEGGPSQIGKFMTVYPPDTDTAVRVAAELDRALRDASGPAVPSDRVLREGGVVSYRYGGFAGRWIQTAYGEVTPALEGPDGTLVPDTRRARDAVPAWLDDPFEAAGLVEPPPPRPALVAERFRVLRTIYRSPRGSVHLALDLADVRRCVLKQAVVDGDPDGPAARLAYEHRMLTRLAGVPGVVRAVGWVDDGRERILALEDISGPTLASAGAHRVDNGFHLPVADVIDVAVQLATVVAAVHAAGVVHRDIKPTNVLLEGDGTVRLIDFELAADVGSAAEGYGTVGYASPEQQRREPTHPADDVYAIGATLYVVATGAEMSSRPPGGPLRHGIAALAPEMPAELVAVIERCLAPTRAERFADAGALRDALVAVRTARAARPARYGTIVAVPVDAPARALAHARALADALCADAVETPTGFTWVSRHPAGPGLALRDLNTGAAGALLALTALAAALPDERYRERVASAAGWLDAAPRYEGPLLGGLYVGEAGVAAALLRAGQLLGDDALLESARRRSREIAALPHGSADLFNGSAGRARLHLWVAEALGDDEALAAARAVAAHLVRTASEPAVGRADWELPEAVGGGRFLGYAHGSAGIADVLLDVAEVTGDERPREVALAAGRWIVDHAVRLGDGAVAWPSVAGERPWAPLWCHGAVGIARFLLHLDRAGDLGPDDRWLLPASGVAAARLGRALGPVACHGLAGSVDLLVDLHRSDGGAGHLAEAWSLADLLEAFHQVGSDGHVRCSSEQPGICSPDLTVGYAGVAATWLRLARPDGPTLLAGRSATTR